MRKTKKTALIVIIAVFLLTGIIASVLWVPSYLKEYSNKNDPCGIENCHGLDITCGSNIPETCTEIYQLGDFCRQYVECKVVDDQCQLVENSKFDQCKSCVEECENLDDSEEAFECEENCRETLDDEADRPNMLQM